LLRAVTVFHITERLTGKAFNGKAEDRQRKKIMQ
jgi:hypothetical protein